MQSERFVVKYISVNNCFAYLPDTWLRKLETKENVIQIIHKDKTYYMSYNVRPYVNEILCLGTIFARSLNIKENDEVFVSFVRDVPVLTKIDVTPLTTSDREILEIQMEKVQSTLLNQIRVVAERQPIIAWVSKHTFVTLIVESLEPLTKCGKLEQLSEIHISDTVVNEESSESNENPKQSGVMNNLISAFKKLLPTVNDRNSQIDQATRNYQLLQSFRDRKITTVYRVHPMPSVNAVKGNEFDEIARCPYHVFISRNQAPKFPGSSDSAICRIKKIPEDKQHVNVTSTNFLTKDESPVPKLSTELIVKVFILEDFLEKFSALDRNHFNVDFRHKSMYVSDSLRISLSLKIGAKVSLCPIDMSETSELSSIELFSWENSVTIEDFKNYVKTRSFYKELLINTCAVIVLDNGNCCIVKISPEDCKFAMITQDNLSDLRIHVRNVKEKSQLRISEHFDQECLSLGMASTRHLSKILSECELALDLSLGLKTQLPFEYEPENILISGVVGSGKTTVCKILIEKLQKPPYFVHTHMIDCRSLKGKKAETLQKIIVTALTECIYYQPSILFLDDLESITSASMNDEENTPDAINAARITDMLINTVMQYQECYQVSVIATCVSVSRIGQKLRPARGCHFFRTILSIPNLEKVDRIDILQLMLGDKLYVPGDVNWDYYGNKTEGWMVQDLVDMAEKAAFAAWKRHGTSMPPVEVDEKDVAIALKNCTPISLQGIQLYRGEGHVWSGIGGLAEVKRSLVEILQWPLKYPEIFKNAPIKLQNGVLLYGMPGTGKTILAKAIANECGVNLISVKGPELLSKYIGVSEESVRNVFERALRAKPCVLFFDEFDSLAPRRGHDSTGVTDRVVNQLLTQMDGVEDREGVAVVAASSRPDLLDPALLRPGRLDKTLYCPLPDEADREEILIALCKTQNIDTMELDLKELATLSSGFTGADLNAAVTQARLAAFEDAVANASDGKIEAEDIKVSQTHLIDSMKSTHPSLSRLEKKKYKSIYAKFAKNDNFVEDILNNQKATLA
ncbi:peroxisome biogenesis factor 1 isoform X1 [Frieseomelitta varia]|uniref:peroxisome biogenesis factor 1 isoform X1 n=2 Tax=Frieseomelitta varia TaxID=561572 RepID=UPI001CB6A4C6|nr:peroxisome biogenesis factor 1 isoform X1 [Frieseomelitta varia]